MADLTRERLSVAEFQTRYPESHAHIELIEGEIIVSPAPIYAHQSIVFQLALRLGKVIPTPQIGQVVLSPSDLYLSADDAVVVQPDLFIILAGNAACTLADGKYWHGSPDICIEVLSPATAKHDRDTKFALYQRYGVREYWIIDPSHHTIEVYALDGDRYANAHVFGMDDAFVSAGLPDFSFSVGELFPHSQAE